MATYNHKIKVVNGNNTDIYHPETNSSQVYDFNNSAWLSSIIGVLNTLSTTQKTSIVASLNELASVKAPLISPTFTGTPQVPTASVGANTTQIANTAFVTRAIANLPANSGIDIVEEIPQNLDGKSIFFKKNTVNGATPEKPEGMSLVELSVISPEMLGKQPSDTSDSEMLQRAIDYCESNNKTLMLSGKEYTLNKTIYFKNCVIDGNGSTLRMPTANVPILKSRVLTYNTDDFGSDVHIRNLVFEGNPNNPNNHGLVISTFWSRYEKLKFRYLGGNGIILTHKGDSGDVVAGGTLVENKFVGIEIFECEGIGMYLGESDNNKITDGYISDVIYAGYAEHGIYIGSGAGWNISNIHFYGRPETVLEVENAFNTIIANIYIEEFETIGLCLPKAQRNLTVSNIQISGESADEDATYIFIDRTSWVSEEEVMVTLSNIQLYHGADGKPTTALLVPNSCTFHINGFNVLGEEKDLVTLSNLSASELNLVKPIKFAGDLIDNDFNLLRYNGFDTPHYKASKFGYSTDVSETFTMPNVDNYGKMIVKVSVDSCVYDNGDRVALWEGKAFISYKDTNDEPAIYTTNIISPTGFSVNPSVTVNRADQTLTVSFTQNNANGAGSIFLEFLAVNY